MVGIIAVKIFVSNPKHFLPLFLKSYFFPNGSSIHKHDPQLLHAPTPFPSLETGHVELPRAGWEIPQDRAPEGLPESHEDNLQKGKGGLPC